MRFISLFAGIGGLDLGLERAGHTCVAQVEWDPYCLEVLRKHWPDVPKWSDIRDVQGDELPRADMLVGGFPCQPFSVAGKQQRENDPRHLWPEFNRLIRVVGPRFVLLENVPGLLAGGFGEVLGDLANGGYDAEWDCIPASAVGAPHLRYRVFVVAYANSGRCQGVGSGRLFDRKRPVLRDDTDGCGGSLADTDSEQLRVRAGGVPCSTRAGEGQAQERERIRPDSGDGRPTVADACHPLGWSGPHEVRQGCQGVEQQPGDQPPVGGRALPDTNRSGLSEQRWPVSVFTEHPAPERCGWWESEPDVGRVAHGIPARVDRLKGLGNAVVPQVAEYIGRRLMEFS